MVAPGRVCYEKFHCNLICFINAIGTGSESGSFSQESQPYDEAIAQITLSTPTNDDDGIVLFSLYSSIIIKFLMLYSS